MRTFFINLKHINPEVYIWLFGLFLLAIMDPEVQHLSLCPLKFVGFEHCPGCGLGHSVTYLVRGDLNASFHAHPLGSFAFILLIYRIIHLTKLSLKKNRN